MLRFSLIFFLGLLLVSCEDPETLEPPQNLIDEDTYLRMFIDLHIFNAMVQSVDSVANRDSLRLALFDNYSITEEDFQATHTYYQSQPTLQKTRLDTASARIERILNEMVKAREESASQ